MNFFLCFPVKHAFLPRERASFAWQESMFELVKGYLLQAERAPFAFLESVF